MTAHAPSNEPLVEAIRALSRAGELELPARLRSVLNAFVSSTLLAADDDGLAVIVTEDDEELLALFTDAVELFAFDPSARSVELAAESAIRKVVAGDYDGLVINPRGIAFELSGEDIEELFEVDPE